MGALYLALVALVTAATLVLVARAWPGAPRALARSAALGALWLAVVGAAWPLSRLTLDLAFLFGSQLTMAVAIGFWLAAVRRTVGATSHADGRALPPAGGKG